jgi:G:T-mismatch repair DNA endonuclease (very short patch repair protein)
MFWKRKLARNVERDREVRDILSAAGWEVMTIWEHDLRADTYRTALRAAEAIAERRAEL